MCVCVCVCVGSESQKTGTKGHNHPLSIISAFRTQTDNAVRSMGCTDSYYKQGHVVTGPKVHLLIGLSSINIYQQRSSKLNLPERVAERPIVGDFLGNLKDNFRILQLGPHFPIFLCQSDERRQQFLKLVQYSGRGQPLITAKQATM